METSRIPANPEEITDFETCLQHTDAILNSDGGPKSPEAARWARRLEAIATDPEQSEADLQHRPFEAYVRQAQLFGADGRPTEQATNAGRYLLEIATNEKDPAAREHRQREAHYNMALRGSGREQLASANMLLALTQPGSQSIRNFEQKAHWEFMGPYTASQVEGFSPLKRLEYAEQAKTHAVSEWQIQTSRDFRNSNPGLPIAGLAEHANASSWGR